ncbi:MAG: hypothetical protein NC092_09305, partial [Butyrivibrio sp.]|nr:hypothetical protein [Butyrivibrio sp.]
NPIKIKKTFKITAVDISKATMNVETKPGTYGVKAASPASITVTCNGVKLKNGTDYTVKYSANTKATQTAKIVVTGKGNYTKKYTSATYVINQLNLSDSGVGIKAVTAYTGVAAGKVKATVTDKSGNSLKASQYTLELYKDAAGESKYEAKDKLEAGSKIYVKALAKDTINLTGATDVVEFTVGTNIAKAKVVLRKEGKKTMTKAYTGQAVVLDKADLTVTIKEGKDTKNLEPGDDYEIVSYSNNVNKGTATAVIKGKGVYSGTKTVKFKIVGKTMTIGGKTSWSETASLIKEILGRH